MRQMLLVLAVFAALTVTAALGGCSHEISAGGNNEGGRARAGGSFRF